MNANDFNNLIYDPGNVPWPVKTVALLAIAALVGFIGYKLIITADTEELASNEAKELELRNTFETKQKRASQLPQYKAQLEEMQRSFVVLSNQLPRDTEIPGLILDISEKGLSNGLELELFEPQPENTMDFYAEKPIKIVAKGTYKELATFVSDLSGLPRIVTINNINLTPVESSGRLKLDAMVKTYRYIQDDEEGINEKQIKDKVAGKQVSFNLHSLLLNHKRAS